MYVCIYIRAIIVTEAAVPAQTTATIYMYYMATTIALPYVT